MLFQNLIAPLHLAQNVWFPRLLVKEVGRGREMGMGWAVRWAGPAYGYKRYNILDPDWDHSFCFTPVSKFWGPNENQMYDVNLFWLVVERSN